MGLDMYLYGATHKYDGETFYSEITLKQVAYWRKHNAIHNWMVKNVQRGEDNCAMYSFDECMLKKLLSLCKSVLANPTVDNAMTILPTVDGFFFGGTDLTNEFELEYYLDGLKYTVEMIEDLLKENFDYFVYESSW